MYIGAVHNPLRRHFCHMAAMRRLLIVINPIAGTKSKTELESYLVDRARQAGMTCMVTHSSKHSTASSLQSIAGEFEATDIIACGGDGTVNMVAEAAQLAGINLGIIPAGSGNGLANCAHIPTKPSAAFDIIEKGEFITIDTFLVNRRFAVMLSGIGMDAAVAERFAHQESRGLATYTTQTLLEFFSATPYQFKISLPEMSFYSDAFFISVANSNQFGNNVTIAPKASLSDGLLDIVIVQKMPKAQLPFAMLRQLQGNNKLMAMADEIRSKHVIYLQTPNLTVENLQHAPLHIDGDPAKSCKEINFSVSKAALRLLMPVS